MQLLVTLAVLAALIISENSPSRAVGGVGYRLLAIILGIGLVAALAAALSGWVTRRFGDTNEHREDLLRRYRFLKQVHSGIWLAVSAGILAGADWPQIVRSNWHLARAFVLDDALILLPVLVPLVLSWAAFYDVDRLVRATSGIGSPWALATRAQYVGLHARHYLGILLIPIFTLIAVQDATEILAPGALQGRYGPLVYALPTLLLFLVFPFLLRYVWDTGPLPDGQLRDRLTAVARRAGVDSGNILVWNTGGMVLNAAVAGFLPKLRCVYLTDGLLDQLTPEEIEVVFGHEVGHVHHRHLAFRVVAMLAPLSLYLLAREVFPLAMVAFEERLRAGGTLVQVPAGLLALAGMGLHAILIFGFYSRLLEGQADLFGCRMLVDNSPVGAVATFVSALEKLAAANGADRNRATWQHASIARRGHFLHRAVQDADFELRFHRRVRLLNLAFVAVAASPLVYPVLLG